MSYKCNEVPLGLEVNWYRYAGLSNEYLKPGDITWAKGESLGGYLHVEGNRHKYNFQKRHFQEIIGAQEKLAAFFAMHKNYRFKTREELVNIGKWNTPTSSPSGWGGTENNHLLGVDLQNIPQSHFSYEESSNKIYYKQGLILNMSYLTALPSGNTIPSQYRLKTLEEFGGRLPVGWGKDMEKFCGDALPSSCNVRIESKGSFSYASWSFSYSDVVLLSTPRKTKEVTTYRFKTLKEFGGKRPSRWNNAGSMDHYMGSIVPSVCNTAIRDKKGFGISHWSFDFTDVLPTLGGESMPEVGGTWRDTIDTRFDSWDTMSEKKVEAPTLSTMEGVRKDFYDLPLGSSIERDTIIPTESFKSEQQEDNTSWGLEEIPEI